MQLKVLTEASGSLTAAYLIKAINDAGCLSVASDIDPECMGRYLAGDFLLMPKKDDSNLWPQIVQGLVAHRIDMIIPSFDETLLMWAQKQQELANIGKFVMLSSEETVRIFQDKWLTYCFFSEHGIPTPATSLVQEFPLVKPRLGRGSAGVRITDHPVDMEGLVSQEVLYGTEFTVDVFCDRQNTPVYIVPRQRMGVKEGKSTGGIVFDHPGIRRLVEQICSAIPFLGPINVQGFICQNGSVKILEINPRIAGGMALGFAATENWVKLVVEHFLEGKPINPKPIQYGMVMKRYYAEVFVPSN